jgi:hypothetical protein
VYGPVGEAMLEDLWVWMSEKVVPWMFHVYAGGAFIRTSFSVSFWSCNVSDDNV